MTQTEKMEYMKNGHKYAEKLGFIGNIDAKYEFMRTGGNFKEALAKQASSQINIIVNHSQPDKESVKYSESVNNLEIDEGDLQSQIKEMENRRKILNDMEDRLKILSDIENRRNIQNDNDSASTYLVETFKIQCEIMNEKYEDMNKKLQACLEIIDEEMQILKNSFKQPEGEKNLKEVNELKYLKEMIKLNIKTSNPLLAFQPVSLHFGRGNIIINRGKK